MKKKLTLALLLNLFLTAAPGAAFGQARIDPMSKEEILQLLAAASEHKTTHGEIATQVERRGISFPVDEKTLEEFRRAGARSFLIGVIRRAGEGETMPRLIRPSEVEKNQQSPEVSVKEMLEELPLIEQTRHYSLQYVNELPNFVVTQAVTRYIQPPDASDWKIEDTLEIELTYREKEGETFKLLRVNGTPPKETYDDLQGSTSTGEFGSLLAAVFLPQSRTSFKEVGREQFNGRSTVVYDFNVKTPNSLSQITDKNLGKTVTSGYNGSIWIDLETKRVLRIEQSHNDIPRSFPISVAENAVEYYWIEIGDEKYLLPIRAEVLLGRESQRFYSRNVIEFKNYQKFEASLKVVPDGEASKDPPSDNHKEIDLDQSR